MLRTREWARRYCDMLDGAEEAPTVNELYKAIELDEDDLVKDAFVQADRYTDQSREEAMKWRMAYYHERGKVGDLQDEVNWLNAELHGAELELRRIVRCKDCRNLYFRSPPDEGYACIGDGSSVTLDGFCAWGVARDGATAIETHPGRDELVDYLCDMCANDCDERKVIRVGQGAYDVCERWKEFDHD